MLELKNMVLLQFEYDLNTVGNQCSLSMRISVGTWEPSRGGNLRFPMEVVTGLFTGAFCKVYGSIL